MGRPPHGGVDRNFCKISLIRLSFVAPHTGAWIETGPRLQSYRPWRVAPHTGAWIETPFDHICADQAGGSPPTRGRGSKRDLDKLEAPVNSSPPTRGRGSKPRGRGNRRVFV